ncbi:MAG: C13 family peptidase, partial [Chloroflexota bacterium]
TPTPTHTPTATFTPSPTSSSTPIPKDDYEVDNECRLANTIQPNNTPQTHTFHTPGDEDWIQFTAPTTATYRIEVDILNNSRADVDLTYYKQCGTLSELHWDETFTPGVRIDIEAKEGETIYLKLTHFDDTVAGTDVVYNLSVRPLPTVDENAEVRRAVIIVAGRYRHHDPLQDNINDTAQYVYQLFQSQQVESDDIRVLAANSIADVEVDDDVTEENLRLAITEWAADKLTAEDGRPTNSVLTLYIIDHGDPDLIYLDKFKDEYLHAHDLDRWLGQLELAVPNLLTNVIIEACHSGSFIAEPNSISAPNRLIIASTSTDSDAYASRNGIHFSDAFITKLQQGHDLATSFSVASENVSNLYTSQEPWLDANGNGIHNEFDDALIAGQRGFNYTGTLGDDNWPPHIFSVALPNGVQDRSGTLLVDVRDNQSVRDVWAVIYPPDYVAPTVEHELVAEQLDTIVLNGQVGTYFSGTYHGFRTCGPYRVVVHARDGDGLQARPIALMVACRQFLPVISR